jgi:ribonuclease HI
MSPDLFFLVQTAHSCLPFVGSARWSSRIALTMAVPREEAALFLSNPTKGWFTMYQIKLYTDGSCLGNPGPGGWACLLLSGQYTKELTGMESQTTNNRMELKAAIEGLSAIRNQSVVEIFSDSSYLVRGMNELIARWQETGWCTSSGKPVQNQDLWAELQQAAARHASVTWTWVAGHSGLIEQQRVDSLAKEAARAAADQSVSA